MLIFYFMFISVSNREKLKPKQLFSEGRGTLGEINATRL